MNEIKGKEPVYAGYVMRTPVDIDGFESFEKAMDYFFSLNEKQQKDFWHVISDIFDKKSLGDYSDGKEVLKLGLKASGLMRWFYGKRHFLSNRDEKCDHVKFARTIGNLRPDALKKFLEKFYHEGLGDDGERVLEEIIDLVDEIWFEIYRRINSRFEYYDKRMREGNYEPWIRELMDQLMKAILKGRVNYQEFHSQITTMLNKIIHRFEINHQCSPDETRWFSENVKEGHFVGIYSIRKWQGLGWVMTEVHRDGTVTLDALKRHCIFNMDHVKTDINDHYDKYERFYYVGNILMHVGDLLQEIVVRIRELSTAFMDFKDELRRLEYKPTMDEMYKTGWEDHGSEYQRKKWYMNFFTDDGGNVHQSDYFGRNIHDDMD